MGICWGSYVNERKSHVSQNDLRKVMILAFRIISILPILLASGSLKENITKNDCNNLVSTDVTPCYLSPAFHKHNIVMKLRSEIQKHSNSKKNALIV